MCCDQKDLETCDAGGKSFWVGKSKFPGGQSLTGLTCPRGEQNLCFTEEGMGGYSDGGGEQDRFKEELVKDVTHKLKNTEQTASLPLSDLYQQLKIQYEQLEL